MYIRVCNVHVHAHVNILYMYTHACIVYTQHVSSLELERHKVRIKVYLEMEDEGIFNIYIRELVDSLCINNVYECRLMYNVYEYYCLMMSRNEPICTQLAMCEQSTPANTVAQRFLPLSILVCMYCVQESVHHCRHKAWICYLTWREDSL